MKKVLLSLGLLAGLTGAAQAQTNSYGIKGGGSLTNYIGSGAAEGSNYRFGVHGGLQADLGVSAHFSVHPEVLYAMKGTKIDRTLLGVAVTERQTLHYVDVPVMARIKFSGFYLELGPQAGVLLAAKGSSEVNGSSQSGDIKNNFSPIDFGYAGGIGFQLANGPGIGARYSASAVSISSNSATPIRNSGFQLYLSYMFGGKQ